MPTEENSLSPFIDNLNHIKKIKFSQHERENVLFNELEMPLECQVGNMSLVPVKIYVSL
jgi:hypothetical protein